jgi:tetratricopeptide (TPR) repeat protein
MVAAMRSERRSLLTRRLALGVLIAAGFAFAGQIQAQYSAADYAKQGYDWAMKGQYDRAIADYNEAIRIDPDFAFAYCNRGLARGNKREYDRAIADFEQAIRLDPNYANAYNDLARLQATCPDAHFRDGHMAFVNASRGYQLSGGKDARFIDTLAAAYAESDDFKKAKEWQVKAIELSTSEKKMQEYRSRLRLYEQRKPYRQEP